MQTFNEFERHADMLLARLEEANDLVGGGTMGTERENRIEEMERKTEQMVERLYTLATSSPPASVAEEVERLARLRSLGAISDDEFKAFSERLTVSSAEKAKGIIESISSLYTQHRAGAMGEGVYRASLWTLLDKLDKQI
jgi:hypothetical protein